MTAPAAVSWAAYLGVLRLQDTILAFLGYTYTPYILSLFAMVELITDQLPQTPSRKTPVQFGVRLMSGGACGAAIGTAGGSWIIGLIAGLIGAVIGTLAGADIRARLARAFRSDLPAALIEDATAIAAAAAIVAGLR
jgi:uncharacterized membrane protein